jgi:hypothetical protein
MASLLSIPPPSSIQPLNPINRVDQLYAALTHQRPRFPPSPLFSTTAHFAPPPTATPELLPKGLPPHTLSPALELILLQLSAASQFLVDIEPHMSETGFYAFGIKRALISDSLLNLRPRAPLEACARDAAILYVLTCLMNMNCEVCSDLVAGLRREISALDFEMVCEQAPGLMLWMVLVGGGGAPRNADRGWFVEVLGRCLRTVGWEEVEERLEGWPWRPRYCASWRAVWRDAVAFARVVDIDELGVGTSLHNLEQNV